MKCIKNGRIFVLRIDVHELADKINKTICPQKFNKKQVTMMNIEAIKRHLEEYKKETLGIKDNGIWWKNQQEYPHILPFSCRYKNIIDKGFAEDLKELIK